MAEITGRLQTYRPYIALGIGILCLSMSAIFIQWAEAPGVITSFYRMAIGALIFVVPFARRNRQARAAPQKGIIYAVLAGACFGMDMALWSTGVTIGGATNPTLMANTAPAWVGLGALIFLREKLDRRFWFGLVLALAGAATILGVDSLQTLRPGLGSLYGLAGGLFYGSYFVVAQRARAYLDALRFLWISMLSSTMVLFLIAALGGMSFIEYPIQTFLIFLTFGVVNQGIGWYAISEAQGHLSATIVSPTLLGQPILTALLAVVLLGEPFGLLQGLGAAGIIGGIYLVHQSRRGI